MRSASVSPNSDRVATAGKTVTANSRLEAPAGRSTCSRIWKRPPVATHGVWATKVIRPRLAGWAPAAAGAGGHQQDEEEDGPEASHPTRR